MILHAMLMIQLLSIKAIVTLLSEYQYQRDYFTPHNQQEFEDLDLDVASGGVMLLPDSSNPPLLVCCGKFCKVLSH
jgi:hypothetical protein